MDVVEAKQVVTNSCVVKVRYIVDVLFVHNIICNSVFTTVVLFVPDFRKLTYIQSRKKTCLSVHLSSCIVDGMITSMHLLLSLPLSSHIATRGQGSQLVSL